MNSLELKLKELDPGLFGKLHETITEVKLLLQEFKSNFPTYTDHSINHTEEVFNLASQLLTQDEIKNLNADEIYILSMSCYLHDIGMCVPEKKIKEIENTHDFIQYRKSNPKLSTEEYIRNIHHELSNKFILEEWASLKIPNKKYAKAIGLVSQGHRKVDLGNVDIYEPKHYIKNGREFVCLPYLASILRLADELDVTNVRTPYLLTKYYMPNNEISIREWKKHIATTQINFSENEVIFEVTCSDQNTHAALQDQFEKIEDVLNYCHKIIRNIAITSDRRFSLNLIKIITKYNFEKFDPKGIRFSFNVPNVIKAFIGEDLYEDELTAIREAIQNAVDSCRYKKRLSNKKYKPYIKVKVNESVITIQDNGLGMDDFIVENFFGKLGSSFYEQEEVKKNFEAIGQFGVGVFSYFLLCDFIDIETKTITGEALKFRIDKDPKSYFHFYPKSEMDIPGTTISLNLKDTFVGKYGYSLIENYIKDIFRFIEFPIEIIENSDNTNIIESRPLQLDSDNIEILKRIKLQSKNEVGDLQLLKVSIDNEDFEGECGLIINKFDKIFELKNNQEYFDYELFRAFNSRHNYSQIAISQKGVFVNNFGSYTMSNLIGNINIKKKQKINIKRNEFTDIEAIHRIIGAFEIKIIEKLFIELEQKLPKTHVVKYSQDFIANFFNLYNVNKTLSNELYNKVLGKYIHVEIFEKAKTKVISLHKLLENIDNFILISNLESKEKVYELFALPVVTTSGYKYDGAYYKLKRIFNKMQNYSPIILSKGNEYFLSFCREDLEVFQEKEQNSKKINKIVKSSSEIYQVNSKRIIVDIWSNVKLYGTEEYNDHLYINTHHPFLIYLIKHYNSIENNKNFKKIFQSSFEYIIEMIHSSENIEVKNIKKINEMLKPLTELEKPYNFTTKDFQIN
jgi:molecular chaperone HtpG